MEFSFIVNASVERTEGKFESRETIENELIEALESANPDSIEGENGGQYEVSDWSVEENRIVKGKAAPKPKAEPAPAVQPAINVLGLIRATVRIEGGDESEEAIDALFVELRALEKRWPKITEQERLKLKGA